MSWALGLLVGAPMAALVIDVGGWRGPFLVVAAAAVAVAVALARTPDTSTMLHDASTAVPGMQLATDA